MKRWAGWGIALVAAVAVAWVGSGYLRPSGPVPTGSATPAPTGPEWIDLFDEKHRDGWQNITDDTEIFAFDGDVLHIFGRTIHPLRYVGYTPERFGDFELHVEFRVTPRANSGVFLRAQPNDPVYRGFEIQVLDDFGKPPHKRGSGSIYDVVTPMFNLALPAGEWNSYDIRVQGGEVVVHMNGWRIIHTDLDQMTAPLGKFPVAFAELPRDGLLLFQDHGGEVWYRNVLLKRLSPPRGIYPEGVVQ